MTEKSPPDLPAEWLRFASFDEYQNALQAQEALLKARWCWGQTLAESCAETGVYRGYCELCAQQTEFQFSPQASVEEMLREQMNCSQCGLNARTRAVLKLLNRFVPPGQTARIYLTEQTTFLYKFVRARWPGVIGSEFFVDSLRARLVGYLKHLIGERELLRFEDVTALSFKDQAMTAIVSCEVLEHVPDFRAALSEFARVLKPGGCLFLTVPFLERSAHTLVRARRLNDGSIEHLEEPEYHGDPVDPNGVLAYYSFAWDLLDELRDIGFTEAHWLMPWSPAEALFGGLWTLQAVR